MNRDSSPIDRVAVGLASGLAATVVMTLGQKLEMALTRRPPSTTPARAVEKVAGVDLDSAEDEKRASTPIHYAYGTALGGTLALLDEVPEPLRTAVFFGLAYGGGAALLSGLDLAPPPTRQKPAEVATDVGHHLVYAVTAGAAYALFTRLAERRRS
jgi:hypothetical protein